MNEKYLEQYQLWISLIQEWTLHRTGLYGMWHNVLSRIHVMMYKKVYLINITIALSMYAIASVNQPQATALNTGNLNTNSNWRIFIIIGLVMNDVMQSCPTGIPWKVGVGWGGCQVRKHCSKMIHIDMVVICILIGGCLFEQHAVTYRIKVGDKSQF